jgi:hypothetical protein
MGTNTAIAAMLKEADARVSEAIHEAFMWRSQCREVERQWEAALLARDGAVMRAIGAENVRRAAQSEAARLREDLATLREYVLRLEARLDAVVDVTSAGTGR